MSWPRAGESQPVVGLRYIQANMIGKVRFPANASPDGPPKGHGAMSAMSAMSALSALSAMKGRGAA